VDWRTYLGGRVWDSLCIGSDGTVYTVLKDGDLVAVGQGGGVAWKFKAAGLPVGNPAAVDDGTVYFALDTGVLYAVSHTGRERWHVKMRAPPVTGPAVGTSGDIYIGTVDRRVFAYRPWGEESWNALLAGVPTDPAISPDGTIYFGTDFGSIVALDQAGEIKWDHLSGGGFLPPVLSGKQLLAATKNGEIVSLDMEGNPLWEKSAGRDLVGIVFLTAGRDLITLTDQGFMLRYRDDGEQTERFDVRGSGSLFNVTPSGKYVFGRDDWLVYAFQGSLPAGTGWPQPGADPQHSSNASDRDRSKEWLEEFADDVDYLFLFHMVNNGAPELKERAISVMREGILQEKPVPPYYRVFLEDLAAEGTLRTSIEYGAITNDFPFIRGSATELLGEIGTLQSAGLLVRLLRYEYDTHVQRKLIEAIGLLRSDRTGLATATISGLVLKDLRSRERPDRRLAEAAIGAIALIKEYHGKMPDTTGNDLLFEIYRGAYPRETREEALQAIRLTF
jgi:outer membrane protein assembly factor BamB